MTKAANVTGYLRTSNKAVDAIVELCGQALVGFLRPQAQCDTRWDTELIMLGTLYPLKAILKQAWDEGRISRDSNTGRTSYEISNNEWDLLAQVIAVFSRAERVTRALEESSGLTISKVYPEMANLFRFMCRADLNAAAEHCDVEGVKGKRWNADGVLPAIQTLKGRFLKSLQERFPGLCSKVPIDQWSSEDKEAFKPYLIAMMLDPTIDNSLIVLRCPYGSSPAPHAANYTATKQDAQRWAKAMRKQGVAWVVEGARRLHDKKEEGRGGGVGSGVGGQNINEEEADFLEGYYDGEGEGAGEEGEASAKVDFVTEEAGVLDRLFDYGLDQTLQQEQGEGGTVRGQDKVKQDWKERGGWKVLKRCADFDWWFRNEQRFPNLARLAKEVFVLQASSAGGERLFSRTGRMCNPLRNRLGGG